MTKKELVKYIAKTYNLNQTVSDYLISDIFDTVQKNSKLGIVTKIQGFGIFKPKITKPRICRDPRNGERVDSLSKK